MLYIELTEILPMCIMYSSKIQRIFSSSNEYYKLKKLHNVILTKLLIIVIFFRSPNMKILIWNISLFVSFPHLYFHNWSRLLKWDRLHRLFFYSLILYKLYIYIYTLHLDFSALLLAGQWHRNIFLYECATNSNPEKTHFMEFYDFFIISFMRQNEKKIECFKLQHTKHPKS